MTQHHDLFPGSHPTNDADICVVTADETFRSEEVSVKRAIGELLYTVRELLRLDVVFVGEIVAGRRVFRHIDTALSPAPIEVGGSHPLHDTLCQRILEGRLPAVIPDVRAIAASEGLPPEYGVLGAHIGVPVRLPGGRLYGMLCGFNLGGGGTLSARDVRRLEIAAASAARLIARSEGSGGRQFPSDPTLV